MQALYAHYNIEDSSINTSEKQLLHSIQKSYDLYILFFLLLIEIRNYLEDRIEIARQKKIPTQEDLNPNKRFINNKIIKQIENNEKFLRFLNAKKLSWIQYPELIKQISHALINSNIYSEYMDDKTPSTYQKDKKFIISFLKEVIAAEENLYTTLEEQSIYWNDEVEFVISMVCKTISAFKEEQGEKAELLDAYKNEDDKKFTVDLFRKSILHGEEYKELLKKFTKNWEIDRIAYMDILLIQLSLAEITEFPFIPVKVTMNEYIEIAKYYSTEKSNIFLNGVLDQIVSFLKKENKIQKSGRGLVGEES